MTLTTVAVEALILVTEPPPSFATQTWAPSAVMASGPLNPKVAPETDLTNVPVEALSSVTESPLKFAIQIWAPSEVMAVGWLNLKAGPEMSGYLLQNYARYPLVLARGKGCHLYDMAGKRYLDFLAGIGVNALGHAHPRLVKVIREQAALLIHSSNLYYHQYQGPLAKRLAGMSGLQRCFFCNSGTEAMEGGLKMVHSHGRAIDPEKYQVIALENGFHGRSFGALSITGQPKYREDFEPLVPGARFVPANDMAALEDAFSDRTAGMVLEMIQGEGGIYPLTPAFVAKAGELSDRYNALLVADETQCGVGRLGTYFAYQRANHVILPDVMVTAKPLACGIPLGVIMANQKAADTIKPGMHGTTFGGGALACRVALEFCDILDELMSSIQRVGGYFHLELN